MLTYNAVNNTSIANPISTCARHVPNALADVIFAIKSSLFIDLFQYIDYVSKCLFTQFITSHLLDKWSS